MNEQIKQLAEQAGFVGRNMQPTFGMCQETALKNFAKLVAKRCIDEIETYQIPCGNSAAGEMACEWTHDALKDIRDSIKQQFDIND